MPNPTICSTSTKTLHILRFQKKSRFKDCKIAKKNSESCDADERRRGPGIKWRACSLPGPAEHP
jgi:hypothetical protein